MASFAMPSPSSRMPAESMGVAPRPPVSGTCASVTQTWPPFFPYLIALWIRFWKS